MRDIRVLEIAGGVDVAYCGRLLAATGAAVVLAEPPGGAAQRTSAPWFTDAHGVRRSATHEYLHAGTRSVVMTPADPDFDAAVRWADVVLSSCDGDVDAAMTLHDRVARLDPTVVHTVVSGFGLTGPYAAWAHSPLVDWAAGGYLYLTGEADREPLQGGGPWASYVTGVTAAISTAAAVMERTRTGRGQLVDVGAMEAVAAAHQWSLTMYTHTGAVKRRWGTRFGEAFHPLSLFRCADDRWICVAAPSRDQWERFCVTTDSVELMADESLYAPGVRFERADEIDMVTAPFFAAHGSEEAVERFQANRVPAARVLDFGEVLQAEQPAGRGFWSRRDDLVPGALVPGAPFVLARSVPGAAPALGEHDDEFRREAAAPGPRRLPRVDLSQVRLVEFGLAWAGPLAGRWLADLGVDVVKVEHPGSRGPPRRTAARPGVALGRVRATERAGRGVPRRRPGCPPLEPHGPVEQDEPQQAQPLPRCQGTGWPGGARPGGRRRRPAVPQLHARAAPDRWGSIPNGWPVSTAVWPRSR